MRWSSVQPCALSNLTISLLELFNGAGKPLTSVHLLSSPAYEFKMLSHFNLNFKHIPIKGAGLRLDYRERQRH